MSDMKPKPVRKSDPMVNLMSNSIYDLPTPVNLSTLWNSGSLLGLCLMIQIFTGIFLAIHYTPNTEYAFYSVVHIMRDVNCGWVLRNTHTTGASLFFMCVYTHIGRGIYYGSYLRSMVWLSGTSLLLSLMATAFLGYVLPWGQMSYWGATVITNLLSAIPKLGDYLVKWIWGGFTVSNSTLNRFFVFHFVLPFLMLALTVMHLAFLHSEGSNNPLGLKSNINTIPFHPFFTLKDTVGFVVLLACTSFISLLFPLLVSDPQNFIKANPMSTPTHIQPEWYFLFAYAILRAIPNKLGGVLAMTLAIVVLYMMPTLHHNIMMGMSFYPTSQMVFWFFLNSFLILTWLGSAPTETPFTEISQLMTLVYFLLIVTIPMLGKPWDTMIFRDYQES
uniref:Cytochrome b n=1 Tax=Venustaconcha ellipsiformis TaxID=301928 RepID=D2DW08_VENEL|nr:cytochrome b [Venustaconcha ellipsiformis]ACQ91035.1 cytochrome b [Venustaconcha ellipsiformis]